MSTTSKAQKVLVIGLDCADPVLMFEKFYDRLPNIKALTQQGLFGPMQSCMPPITVPAWSCMASSKDPGQLGVYGFRNRADWSYNRLSFATSLEIKEPRIWNILSQIGKKSFVLGVPGTYPPSAINGWMVGCFLSPSIESNYTYPVGLKNEIAEVFGEYMIDVKGYRTEEKKWLLDEIYKMSSQRFAMARHFMKKCDWDLFWMVDMGVDRIHHGFWQFMDPTHHRYVKGGPWENAIFDLYKFIDDQIGELLKLVDLDKTAVWIVSDHGAKCMTGGVCFNDWLIRQGYLTLTTTPNKTTKFSDVTIDWSKTKAWGEGGYYGRCFFNVQGREQNGQIPQKDYEKFAQKLSDELTGMVDHEGKPMGTKVYRPSQLYKTVKGTPPDLIVLFGNLNWRSVGTVGNPSVYTFENDTGPDDANHNTHGIFITAGAGLSGQTGRREITIYDFAPTVMSQMNLPLPKDMIGKNIIA
ncbi:MAG: alkaline phosphatase family protein [Phycisphaerae bacterium]